MLPIHTGELQFLTCTCLFACAASYQHLLQSEEWLLCTAHVCHQSITRVFNLFKFVHLSSSRSQWPAGEDRRAVLATSGSAMSRRMPTLNRCPRCGDLRSPGVTERRSGPFGLRGDDDSDDDAYAVTSLQVLIASA